MGSFAPFTVSMLIAIVVAVVILLFAFMVLWKIFTNEISLQTVLSETDTPKASLSRLQFLIFTFVIAGLYLVICIESGSFVEIPTSVLGLIGISGGSYLVSKGISRGKEKEKEKEKEKDGKDK